MGSTGLGHTSLEIGRAFGLQLCSFQLERRKNTKRYTQIGQHLSMSLISQIAGLRLGLGLFASRQTNMIQIKEETDPCEVAPV